MECLPRQGPSRLLRTELMRSLIPWLVSLFRFAFASKAMLRDLALENLALRHQLTVHQRHGRRVSFRIRDRAFWVVLRRIWPQWRQACVLVKPETVVHWHRTGFRLFWRWKSRRSAPSKARIERVQMIRRMASENPRWGAPRIQGELQKLGYRLSQSTVQRYMPRRTPTEKQRQSWKVFLDNHRDSIAAMDFITVPTATFGRIYALVILLHGRRRVAHVNVTKHPTAEWVKQQLREAFPFDEAPKYLIFDRDTIFGAVKGFVRSMGIQPKQISFRCPWQNGAIERLMRSIRGDVLDHVVVFNENHLRRLLKEYFAYYHEDRTHLALNKDSPLSRPVEHRPHAAARVIGKKRLGGLHHRYTWDDAA